MQKVWCKTTRYVCKKCAILNLQLPLLLIWFYSICVNMCAFQRTLNTEQNAKTVDGESSFVSSISL